MWSKTETAARHRSCAAHPAASQPAQQSRKAWAGEGASRAKDCLLEEKEEEEEEELEEEEEELEEEEEEEEGLEENPESKSVPVATAEASVTYANSLAASSTHRCALLLASGNGGTGGGLCTEEEGGGAAAAPPSLFSLAALRRISAIASLRALLAARWALIAGSSLRCSLSTHEAEP